MHLDFFLSLVVKTSFLNLNCVITFLKLSQCRALETTRKVGQFGPFRRPSTWSVDLAIWAVACVSHVRFSGLCIGLIIRIIIQHAQLCVCLTHRADGLFAASVALARIYMTLQHGTEQIHFLIPAALASSMFFASRDTNGDLPCHSLGRAPREQAAIGSVRNSYILCCWLL